MTIQALACNRVRLDTVPPADQGTLTYTDANGTVVQIAPASPPTLTPAQAATLSFTPAPGFGRQYHAAGLYAV